MYTSKDWIKAISKLIEITSMAKITWTTTTNFADVPNEKVDKAYQSTISDKVYVVKKIRCKEYYDAEPEDFNWAGPYFTLEIYKNSFNRIGDIMATAPANSNLIGDLYHKIDSSVVYQSGVLDDLLKFD